LGWRFGHVLECGWGVFGHVEEETDYAAMLGLFEFDAGCEGTELGIGGDLFDGLVAASPLDLTGKVRAGDLEAVEEEAGAFGVDLVAGDAAEDLAYGALDGRAVFGQGEVEVGLSATAVAGIFDGTAGGVVVVTKFFVTEAWTAAAMAVGVDVAALIAFGCFLHGGSPPLALKVSKYSKQRA
jgi:hypothetical protein